MWTDFGDIFCTGVAYAVCSVLGSDGPVNLGNVLWCFYGGLTQMMFQLLLCFGLFSLVYVKFKLTEWYPLFSKAFSYSTLAELNISILDEFLESL